MIAYLRGELLERTPASVVLNVQGVGYEVLVPVSTFSQLPAVGATVELRIHTHVREDAIQLFGFLTAVEKSLFEKLITVSGIGPRLALSILSGVQPGDLVTAIRQSNLTRLTAIPGVGKKTAERVVVELRDKLDGHAVEIASAPTAAPLTTAAEDVLSALVNLGYNRAIAEKAVAKAATKHPEGTFDDLFKECMKSVG